MQIRSHFPQNYRIAFQFSFAFVRRRCSSGSCRMDNIKKGNEVKFSTFKSWGQEEVLGFKTEEIEGATYVVFIWCKVCTRNSTLILNHPKCKGEAKDLMKAFIDGTNGVTKQSRRRKF